MNADRKKSLLTRRIRQQRRGVISGVGGAIVATVMVLALVQGGLALSGGSAARGQKVIGFNTDVYQFGTYAPTHGFEQAITFLGEGTFTPPAGPNDRGSVQGAGIWAVDNGTTGLNIASGSWTEVGFVSWVSYGLLDPREEGGNLTTIVALSFDGSRNVVDATLYISCINNLPGPPLGSPYMFDGQPVFEASSLVGSGFDFTIVAVLNSSFPSFGIGINDFIPDVSGAGLSDTATIELAAISRSSVGACHLGCC